MDNSDAGRHESSRMTASVPRIITSERWPSKLRETCHACALSKVRCSKEKPSCTRCSKRGVTCEYIVTKRPGRKRDATKSTFVRGTRRQGFDAVAGLNGTDASCMWFEDMLPAASGRNGNANGNGDGNGRGGTSDKHLDSTQAEAHSPMLWPLTAGDAAELAVDVSDFLIPLITPLSSTFTVETPDFLGAADYVSAPNTPQNGQPMQDGSSVAQLLIPDGARQVHGAARGTLSLDLLSNSSPRSLYSVPASSPASRIVDDSDLSPTSCCCLVRALEIMARLSSSDTADPVVSATSRQNAIQDEALLGHAHAIPFLDTTFRANKQTIEALGTMLHGSCQEDVYLLTCMSMIVFKVLRRYEAAAGQSMSTDAHEAGHCYEMATLHVSRLEARQRHGAQDGDSLRRGAAQLVLGELHLVQQLVNRLSLRLRNSMDRTPDDGVDAEVGDGMLHGRATSFDDKADTSFFSAATLNRMEHDLRKALAMLSSNIINMLRRI
ncbi:hypothetical protein E4U42_003884 [Claviceps africana]|uniref:Zn(2)-C6 fungal-type domain-containing protein n=1 Tax=Claviceps africana TaxID=83212 RepID=A0A8K0NHF1_9HYPO|nr:hypothetical protein E4U42_003884 [Claviceps africana]